ncbi:kinase-like domain-containing protein [Rhizophagus irregularis DAOM 181602=DAOM 197198]|nr:kinase-like domain-containing protein [Rhizophagus irregularis DAOM 181602=DAOM 197198]
MSSQDDDDQCKKCGEKYMSEYDAMYKWCKSCQINNLKQNFTNWTSENEKIDNLIQEMQLEINELDDMIFEWIPYDQFDDIKEIGEGSDKVHLAIWKDGPLDYDKNKNEYTRKQQNKKIVLKLYNLRNIINEFFIDQDKKYSITYIGEVLRIHGISQYPNTEDYIIVFQDIYCVKEWTRKSNKVVTLKYLYNSQNVIKHLNMIKFNKYSKMYGVSQNPDTEIYILIFQIYIVKMRYRGKNFGISQNPYTNDYITILQNDYDGTCTKCGKYDVESECHWSIWKNGPLSFHDKKWTRESNKKVYLRLHYLHYLQNTDKSLDKICKNDLTVYGISLNKNTKYCIIVSQYVNLHCERCGKELNYCERSAWKDGPLSYNKHDKYVEDKKKFILKQLDDSQNIATEFLDVIKKYSIKSCDEILTVYGISQDPDKGGNLYNFINKQYEKFDWFQCYMYYYWSYENQMVHRDLHTATGRQPFSNHAHDEVLALDICNGIRPDINDQEAPKCYIDLMKWCWNSNPDNRPNVAEVHKLVDIFHLNTCGEQRDYDIQEQFKKANKYKKSNYFLEGRRKSAIHSQAVYTSQLLNSLQKVFLILNV